MRGIVLTYVDCIRNQRKITKSAEKVAVVNKNTNFFWYGKLLIKVRR